MAMDSTSFTFLATILILVLLSATLVLRSYILRRRYRRHFQQALADGLFDNLDRSGPGELDTIRGFRRSIRRFGPKPIVWDTWIHPADKHDTWSAIRVLFLTLFAYHRILTCLFSHSLLLRDVRLCNRRHQH